MFYKYLLLVIACVLFTSCEDEIALRATSGTWLGGQVINPVSNMVIIKRNDSIITRAQLNQNNRFMYKFDKFEPGLYEFAHKERQLVYLNEGDSVIFRVNTLEYDQSLTFTGYGAEKSNLLIDLFLMNEEENKRMALQAIYKKEPQAFETYLDSLKQIKTDRWDVYASENEQTQDFEEFVEAVISYDIYARKEVYPLTNFVNSKLECINQIPETFYEYRSSVSFNEERFLPLYSYQRFLYNYFNHAAFKNYASEYAYDAQSFRHNLTKLRLIDSLVSNDKVKSFLLTHNIRNFLYNSNDKEESTKLYECYMEHAPETEQRNEIERLYRQNKKIETGKKIPNIALHDDTLEERRLLDIINKPAIIYFWSTTNASHMIRSHLRAKKIRDRFPQYQVIAINIDPDKQLWLQILSDQGFERDQSYHFTKNADQIEDDFTSGAIIRTFITDEQGIILNAHTNMFGSRFENQLLGYLNKCN